MKRISIRDLHSHTGKWVRRAAQREAIVVTDRGQPVAALVPFDREKQGKPLPNRWKDIQKMQQIPVDSSVYISEMRERA